MNLDITKDEFDKIGYNHNKTNSLTNYKNIPNEIIENFPFTEPRKGQLEIISEIYHAIEKGYKYIVLEAGTGTGKSVIAATLAKMYNSTFILTMTKQLQEQYLNDFKDHNFHVIKGRNNFKCMEKSLYSNSYQEKSSCNNGTCLERYDFKCKYGLSNIDSADVYGLEHAFKSYYWKDDVHCKYWSQKAEGINSDLVIMNYDYALYEFNYPHDFAKRNLLILDEAHNIEKKIMGFVELELIKEDLENEIKLKIADDEIKHMEKEGYVSWISFVKYIKRRYNKESKKFIKKISKKKDNETEAIIRKLKDEIDKFNRFINYIEKDPKNWIMIHEKDSIFFKPLKIHEYAKDYLLNYGDICLFMSATILDYEKFAEWLGLNKKEVYHLKVETPFSVSKRPIESNKTVDMTYRKLKKNAPETLDIISEILNKHKNDKGLIHTVSYKCKDYLIKNLNNSRLITHDADNRFEILNKFEKSKKPLVLLSPSMNEGVNLPYDKCRFQIIYKLPFPSTSDKQVSMRIKSDRHWYPYQTIMNLVQAYGRGMRAEDDYCQTYIIDSRLKFYAEKSPLYRRLVPKFFKEAIAERE
ncbi:bifunctional ATP-dependent DNA helicase/DNA polymerase III subunit epsilon [Methanobrevibacter cuticularis]|uniref:Bifunctional ATP-dependent DNA helicase/DNA polymerase III subunit epsilon n=1 Tax=Methanobrevibacter cuticularis TaxID=47311 RepID=A0A166EKZ7_9EURY|nr:ATP-dependent DNA helicase [Methanobrevibacter cuticularis]KZX16772.1 bifunctional ATP-dependent DNA helicase/DNA polymerase III subunit epsilon [Methanobrevibacter cuticularis]